MIATIASRVGGAQVLGRLEPAGDIVGQLAHRAGSALEAQQRPRGLRDDLESVVATSPRPLWFATTGSAPQAAPSAATIPNASGNVLGTTIASVAGSRSASSAWSSRPAHTVRCAPPR